MSQNVTKCNVMQHQLEISKSGSTLLPAGPAASAAAAPLRSEPNPPLPRPKAPLAVIPSYMMSARRILQLGDPLLRTVSAPVSTASHAAPVFQNLRATLHQFRLTHGFGRGISAVQIGEPLRLIYLEFEGTSYPLRNPEYEFQSEAKFRLWDDCFSFPGLLVYLERSQNIRVRYQDEQGQPRLLQADGALSELLQHEID